MRPEEVPVQFARETIVQAITTWSMGTTLFPGEDEQALGQLFAILVGDRIRLEAEGHELDPDEFLEGFIQHLQGQVPEELRSQFATLEPERFDATYLALIGHARESGVDLEELSLALREIAAVTRHFAEHLPDTEA